MNRSFASFGNRSHGKGLLMLSDDEESGDENDYHAKTHNKSISSLFSKHKQSDDDSIHLSGDEDDDNKTVNTTKSFLSKVVSKSFGVSSRRRRSRSKSTSRRRESDGTASTAAASSPRSSPEPKEMDTSSWGNLDPEESLSQMFLSPEDSGAAQLVFAEAKKETSSAPAVTPSPASPRRTVSESKKGTISPKQSPRQRQTPQRSKTTGSMSMMFLSDMDSATALHMQCAASCAAPKAAPSKRKKNKDALEAYNAKVAAKKAAKEAASSSSASVAGAATATSTHHGGKHKVKIRVKVPAGSDPAMVAAMAVEAAKGNKVPMRIKRSDDSSTSPVKKRSTLGRQPQCPTTPGRTRSAPIIRRAPSCRKVTTTTSESEQTSATTPKSPRAATSDQETGAPESPKRVHADEESHSATPQTPRTRRLSARHRSTSRRTLEKHQEGAPESPKRVQPDEEETKSPTPQTPRTGRLGARSRAMSRRT